MIRAAAKNCQTSRLSADPADYKTVVDELKADGCVSKKTKLLLAYKVFHLTSAYDTMIAEYLRRETGSDILPDSFTMTFDKVEDMRYGENPHQRGAFYREIGNSFTGTLACAKQLHGKELSYNNISDANGALDIIKEYGAERPCAEAVKHANPCGIGIGETCTSVSQGVRVRSGVDFRRIIALIRRSTRQPRRDRQNFHRDRGSRRSLRRRFRRIEREKEHADCSSCPTITLPNKGIHRHEEGRRRTFGAELVHDALRSGRTSRS